MSIQRRIQDPTHPALRRHDEERRETLHTRLADGITRFAGSMRFVYLHAAWFALWIALGIEPFPFGFLTMLVSLEAIFLGAFVLISQNRADERRTLVAEHQWELAQEHERRLEEVLSISRQGLALARRATPPGPRS